MQFLPLTPVKMPWARILTLLLLAVVVSISGCRRDRDLQERSAEERLLDRHAIVVV